MISLSPLLSKLRHRGRIIFDPEAVAWEETAPHIGSEFRRRVRIGTGAYQSLPLLWRLLNPRYGWTAFAFLSHRSAVDGPFFSAGHGGFQFPAARQCTFPGRDGSSSRRIWGRASGHLLAGRSVPCKLVRVLTMFTGMNLALLVGFWRWLVRPQTGTWHRTARDAGSGKLPQAAACAAPRVARRMKAR